jgi:hypothetical protein
LIGGNSFKNIFNRLFELSLNKNISAVEICRLGWTNGVAGEGGGDIGDFLLGRRRKLMGVVKYWLTLFCRYMF